MMKTKKVLCLLAASISLLLPAIGNAEGRNFQSLDGAWQIVFDPANEGGAKQWVRKRNFPREQMRDIAVPSCWELIEKDYEGVAYYRHAFQVPENWAGKTVRLHFDAVNFRSEVWLNDTAVGMHEGGFTPFEFRVDDLLKFDGENTLILRVVGPILMQDKRVDGMGPMETPQWRGAITGGIWQPVRLIATGDVYVKDVFIEPKISDNTATFHTDLAHDGKKAGPARVTIAIRPVSQPDQVAATISKTLDLKPGLNRQDWTLKIPDAAYWSPDHPHLYRAEVSVAFGGTVSDRWETRFGMREFTIRDKKFYLNGKPLYLKATFFEGLYPVKLAYPDSREMAIPEIQLAKDAGFNMIRPWRKPPPPMWLDLADELGVLTVGSLAVECMDLPIESASLSGWIENELRESIWRDRNRTCVVQGELFNENSTKTSGPRTRSRMSPGNPSSRPSATTGSLITTCANATTSAPATPGGAPTCPSFPSAKAAASPRNFAWSKTSARIPLRTRFCSTSSTSLYPQHHENKHHAPHRSVTGAFGSL